SYVVCRLWRIRPQLGAYSLQRLRALRIHSRPVLDWIDCHTSAYLVTTILTILVFFVAANLLALTASRKALEIQERNRQPLDMDQLRLEFKITNRESELVALVIEGLSNKEIGERLFISEGTVKNHLHSIMRKLGVRN